jgi:hypothetical protein
MFRTAIKSLNFHPNYNIVYFLAILREEKSVLLGCQISNFQNLESLIIFFLLEAPFILFRFGLFS